MQSSVPAPNSAPAFGREADCRFLAETRHARWGEVLPPLADLLADERFDRGDELAGEGVQLRARDNQAGDRLAAGVLTITVMFHADLEKAKVHPATDRCSGRGSVMQPPWSLAS